jgi:hypothetical protein
MCRQFWLKSLNGKDHFENQGDDIKLENNIETDLKLIWFVGVD